MAHTVRNVNREHEKEGCQLKGVGVNVRCFDGCQGNRMGSVKLSE